jgi:Cof subfamily protein (haloacid dehalogenase superfamily)
MSGKFDGVLLASDFDNTLIYTEEALRSGGAVPSLSPGNRQALEYFTANGGRFAIATGRALAAFEGFAGDLPMNAPGVVCNGAAIYDFAKGEYLETALLDGQVRARGQVLLDLFPGVAVEAYHIGNVIHAVHPNAVTRRHEHITHVGVEQRPSLAEVPLPLGKLLFEGEHAELEALRSELRRRGWDADYELIFSNPFLLELTRRGANKGGMVLRLAALLDVRRENIYCAGDEANDISMLTAAAQGFAPANCVPAVRDCGATVVADARADAMAEIVSILDRRYAGR